MPLARDTAFEPHVCADAQRGRLVLWRPSLPGTDDRSIGIVSDGEKKYSLWTVTSHPNNNAFDNSIEVIYLLHLLRTGTRKRRPGGHPGQVIQERGGGVGASLCTRQPPAFGVYSRRQRYPPTGVVFCGMWQGSKCQRRNERIEQRLLQVGIAEVGDTGVASWGERPTSHLLMDILGSTARQRRPLHLAGERADAPHGRWVPGGGRFPRACKVYQGAADCACHRTTCCPSAARASAGVGAAEAGGQAQARSQGGEEESGELARRAWQPTRNFLLLHHGSPRDTARFERAASITDPLVTLYVLSKLLVDG